MEKMNFAAIHGGRCWPSIERISPCEDRCPIHMDIPGYVIAVSQGKFQEALHVIRETNPLPSVCGRVCHHPCEEVCNRKAIDAPVAIRSLKRFVLDFAAANITERVERFKTTRSEKVAVVGSGPAGLTAAYDLVRMGYPVAVYESATSPGGMLLKGIPEFLLPRKIVERDIEYLVRAGVKIRTSMGMGRDFALEDLKRKGFSAVLLATGTHQGLDFPLEGRSLSGIEVAIEFLMRVKDGLRPKGKGRLLVIGGGNVAVDVARVARRAGYAEVHLACLECRSEMPAFQWEIRTAESEGVVFHNALAPQRFVGEARIRAVEFHRVRALARSVDGRLSWTLEDGAGSFFSLDVDRVVIAIGQRPNLEYLEGSGISLQKGHLVVEERVRRGAVPAVFVAGDITNPQGTAIEAIRDGRAAAKAIAGYLDGKEPDPVRKMPAAESFVIDRKQRNKLLELLPATDSWEMPKLPTSVRVRCQEEVDLGFSEFQAVQEARRCLNCRTCLNCILDRKQLCYMQSTRLLAYNDR